jgi:hypothetical protein
MSVMDRRGGVQRWLKIRHREGLTYRELSARSGIPANTLAHWAWRLRREGKSGRSERVAFVEVSSTTGANSSVPKVEIITRTDRRLLVDADLSPELLQRLVGALERC